MTYLCQSTYIEKLQTRQLEGENGLSFFIAMIYAGGQDAENTLKWLKKSFENKDFELSWVIAYPTFRFLYDNLEFKKIAKKMNLKIT